MTRRIRCNAGFTLIEMMVVLLILGLMTGIVTYRFVGQTDKARYQAAKTQMQVLEAALQSYKIENGRFPTTAQGLQALVQKPSSPPIPRNWPSGGYLQKAEVPTDPWGNEFIYVSPGQHNSDYDLVSLGADGIEGGEEDYDKDIQSWSL